MGIPNWLIKLSVIVNTMTCGPKGYSLCARFYKRKQEKKLFGHTLVVLANAIFFFDKDHCRKAFLLREREVG